MSVHLKTWLPAVALILCCAGGPASSDCCGPPPAPQDETSLGQGWSGSLFFERMEMRSLYRGAGKISGDEVITERLNGGSARYSIPTDMVMDRASLQLRYTFDEENSLRLTLPWRFNSMDMRSGQKMMAAKAGMGGMAMPAAAPAPMFMNMSIDPVDGLGDIVLTYNYSFALDEGRAYVGGGVQVPTGDWTVRDARGALIHNMTQPGSGAPAFFLETRADFPLGSDFSLHPRFQVQWNGTNPLGYQRGARADYGLETRYQIIPEVGLSLDLLGFSSGRDSSNGTIDQPSGQIAFQRPEISLVDNVANTGGQALFLAPGLRIRPSDDIQLGFQYRFPIHQNYNGTQLGIDAWYRVFLSASF